MSRSVIKACGVLSKVIVCDKGAMHRHSPSTILDINYVDFLQFQRYFRPQAELEEAFTYIIRKPIYFSIDFSCRLKT